MSNLTPAERLLRFFKWEHLKDENAREMSKKFHDLAQHVNNTVEGSEATTAIRKLLEGKDCAVRSVMFEKPVIPAQ